METKASLSLEGPTSEPALQRPVSGTRKSSRMMRQKQMCAPSWELLHCLEETLARLALQVTPQYGPFQLKFGGVGIENSLFELEKCGVWFVA